MEENSIIERLSNYSKKLTSLKEDKELLFKTINSDKLDFLKIKQKYFPKSYQPVNLLRFLLANELEKGQVVSIELISEIKKAIEDKDISSYFASSEKLANEINNAPIKSKSPFSMWKEPFYVLFPFVLSDIDDQEQQEMLNKLCDSLVEHNNLVGIKKHIVSFWGPRNIGAEQVWCAIIPSNKKRVQDAYQLFFSINENGLQGGIHKGQRINSEHENQHIKYKNWEDFLINSIDLINDWKEKNNSIKVNDSNIEMENIKKEYSRWLKGDSKTNITSYVRAIDILNEILDRNIYLENDIAILMSLYDDLIKEQGNENGKYYYKKAISYGKNGFFSASVKAFVDFLNYKNEVSSKPFAEMNNSNNGSVPLNQILYGPPGTGKTYNTVATSVAIIQNKTSKEIKNIDRDIVKSDFDLLSKKNQILFTTFHQSMSYEDFIEGIKPKLVSDSDQETDEITYEVSAGIFKHAVARAAYNSYREYHKVGTSKYTFSQLYDAFIELAKEKIIKQDHLICETKTGLFVEIYKVNKNDSIKARAKGSLASHVAPLTKENLQKLYDTYKSIKEINSLQEIREVVGVSPRTTEFYAVFKSLLIFEKAAFNPTIENEELLTLELSDDEIIRQFDSGVFNDMSRKHGGTSSPVVLIIDEINRGNVSAIFGELITLLEEDKRLGMKNELLITLPYSKNKFSVPSNLYVIGTMNTADRSVEALDSALRRRFSFIEMMPDYDLQELNTDLKINLSQVLKEINQRIEILLDREHQIGHSYFINIRTEADLLNAFENKIIPLLQEYFYNDYDKIGLILGKELINKTTNPKITFANFSFENSEELIEPIYKWVELNKENIVFKVNSILSSND